MGADDVELHSLPMYHCAQLDCFFSVDVYLGATSIILPGPDPAALLADDRAGEGHRVVLPADGVDLPAAAPGLRHPRPVLAAQGLLRRLPDAGRGAPRAARRLPDVQLWNFYGQTEMAPLATILQPHEQLPIGRLGRPGRDQRRDALVDDAAEPVPPGAVGEIVHRSPHAALGYYADEEKTAEAFAGGWFHSGDLGVLTEDGYLSVVDRKKDMIKTGGENVATREVEEAIYQLDGVAEVAVFGISHPHWIEAVTAVVVPKPGATITAEHVDAHAASTWPAQAPQVRRPRRRSAQEPQRQDPQAGTPRPARRPRRGRRVKGQVARP